MSIPPLASGAPAAVERTPPPGNSQQLTQLDQLVSKYKGDVTRRASPQVLASLSRQIAADARTVGKHIVLPPASAATTSSAAPVAGKVNVMA
jgi:hypothetical protein